MVRSLLISTGIHIVLLLAVVLFGMISEDIPSVSPSVSIRLGGVHNRDPATAGARGGEPSEVARDFRRSTGLPARVTEKKVADIPSQPVRRFEARSTLPGVESTFYVPPGLAVPDTNPDPLAGLDAPAARNGSSSASDGNPWSISWLSGGERGILSFPEVDWTQFPQDLERLRDVRVQLAVSPAGDVVSARMIEPGSGDVRIDRYLNTLVYRLYLEPWPVERGMQEGELMLRFQDEGP